LSLYLKIQASVKTLKYKNRLTREALLALFSKLMFSAPLTLKATRFAEQHQSEEIILHYMRGVPPKNLLSAFSTFALRNT
jgi:hypothetical protein